jgi:hypothetical protein
MRKHICIGVLAMSFLASMLAGANVSAKSVNNMKAEIPFDFHVGGQLIPAGEYTVTALTEDDAALRISGGQKVAIALTTAKEAKLNSEPRSRLVFHKYGDQYFLAAVWGADRTGRELPESKRERSLRKEMRVAQGGAAQAEVVTIVAQ